VIFELFYGGEQLIGVRFPQRLIDVISVIVDVVSQLDDVRVVEERASVVPLVR